MAALTERQRTDQAVKTAATKYFREVAARMDRPSAASPERTFYTQMEDLLKAIGSTMSPDFDCMLEGTSHSKDNSLLHPDFMLFDRKQPDGENPKYGVVEAKGIDEDISSPFEGRHGEQMWKYFHEFGLLTVTNYRELRLYGPGNDGNPKCLEKLDIADSKSAFRDVASNPIRAANNHGTHIWEFLKRSMNYKASISNPQDVAWFLASYAREALQIVKRVTADKTIGTLQPLKKALEAGLGENFGDSTGNDRFCSTMVQTLFYGMFSAWATLARDEKQDQFDWRRAGFTISIPVIQSLFDELTKSSSVQQLGLVDVLDRASDALRRVDKSFFDTFDSENSIQHFYQPFLKEFDPDMQRKMGVWYTPPEIVRYMVERVDTVLREELGKKDGLASKDVYVLDPCCGTGTYIIEVLRKIAETLKAKKKDGLIGYDVKQAALNRIKGFELMPAPFVIAHWQVNDFLRSMGAPPPDSNEPERVAIILTNALTGRDQMAAQEEMFQDIKKESELAFDVKKKDEILVVIGNPPYNAFAGKPSAEAKALTLPYRKNLDKNWNIRKSNFNDPYTMFMRIAEMQIEKKGSGIVSYITNHSWTYGTSYVEMRKHLLRTFDKMWIENMHGDRKVSERAPDGSTSNTIFSMPGFSTGIQQGVVTSLFVKKESGGEDCLVRYRNDIDAGNSAERRQQLLDSLNEENLDEKYEIANPGDWNLYSIRPIDVYPDYRHWPSIDKLRDQSRRYPGMQESRGGALIDSSENKLSERMKLYFNHDRKVTWEELKLAKHPLTHKKARYEYPLEKRTEVLSREDYSDDNLVRYALRPFDPQYAYYSGVPKLWNEHRAEFWKQHYKGSRYLVACRSHKGMNKYPVSFAPTLGDNAFVAGSSSFFPFCNLTDGALGKGKSPNLSQEAQEWLESLVPSNVSDAEEVSALMWFHVLGICHSPNYISENADMLEVDWPRVPLPNDQGLLVHSSSLGTDVASLLDLDCDVSGRLMPDSIGGFGAAQEIENLTIDVGWGLRRKDIVTGGKGRIRIRDWDCNERKALPQLLDAFGLELERGLELLGPAVDIYLNETNYWKGVPEKVWQCQIGDYRVIKKWLSYREGNVLGRPLEPPEARVVSDIVHRLMALILMTDRLNANYVACRETPYQWPTGVS